MIEALLAFADATRVWESVAVVVETITDLVETQSNQGVFVVAIAFWLRLPILVLVKL